MCVYWPGTFFSLGHHLAIYILLPLSRFSDFGRLSISEKNCPAFKLLPGRKVESLHNINKSQIFIFLFYLKKQIPKSCQACSGLFTFIIHCEYLLLLNVSKLSLAAYESIKQLLIGCHIEAHLRVIDDRVVILDDHRLIANDQGHLDIEVGGAAGNNKG